LQNQETTGHLNVIIGRNSHPITITQIQHRPKPRQNAQELQLKISK